MCTDTVLLPYIIGNNIPTPHSYGSSNTGMTLQHKCGLMDVHLVVEDLGLARYSSGDEVSFQNIEDILADPGNLSLDLRYVSLEQGYMTLIAIGILLLLDR